MENQPLKQVISPKQNDVQTVKIQVKVKLNGYFTPD